MPVKVGDQLPSVELHEGDPHTVVNTAELFKKKKGVLFGVPGAFTPGCSKTHLPSFLENAEAIKKKGVDVIACVAVNDAFVMDAWGKANKAEGKVRMLADPSGALAKALDLLLDSEQLFAALGNRRCKRFVMVVVDGTVKAISVEPDGTGLSCSLAPNVMQMLDSVS
nr:peroxiredoxin-5, mitochondrial-like [Callorhinchus milii]AFK11081.1 Peroxiredoxin-5, mitochondrial [Callorhinchus milii]AFM90206.1 Peroxiredoxin-5, mitochondrial [Callorhinchus milii]